MELLIKLLLYIAAIAAAVLALFCGWWLIDPPLYRDWLEERHRKQEDEPPKPEISYVQPGDGGKNIQG